MCAYFLPIKNHLLWTQKGKDNQKYIHLIKKGQCMLHYILINQLQLLLPELLYYH